jgi:hypothetical protein
MMFSNNETWCHITGNKSFLKLLIYILYKIKLIRDLSLMVKYETFNLWYVGSNPIGLKFNILNVDN